MSKSKEIGFKVSDKALTRTSWLESNYYYQEVLFTKEAFLECYNKWVKPGSIITTQ